MLTSRALHFQSACPATSHMSSCWELKVSGLCGLLIMRCWPVSGLPSALQVLILGALVIAEWMRRMWRRGAMAMCCGATPALGFPPGHTR